MSGSRSGNLHREPAESETDAPLPEWTDADRARIEAIVLKWAPVLFLDTHHINVRFSDKPDDGSGGAATMSSNIPYESGHGLTFYRKFLGGWADAASEERAVLHELTHIIVAILYDISHMVVVQERFVPWHEFKRAHELLTDRITNIVFELAGKGTESA